MNLGHRFPNKNQVLSKQAGQAVIEYVLLLSISIGVAVAIFGEFNRSIRGGYGVLNAEIEKNLQTGGFEEASLWFK